MALSRSSLLSTTKKLLKTHGIQPSRGLGQNFLVDPSALGKLLGAARINPKDTVLEIGPGIGTLTQELAQRAKRVVAVEKDAKMVEILQETLAEFDNVELIHGDILKTNFPPNSRSQNQNLNKNPLLRSSILLSQSYKYKVVANLPYYITAPVIRKFLETEKPDFEREKVGLQSMTLVVQKEVAQRICAKPPDMSILAVAVQVYATPKIISLIKKSSFWPQPTIDSAIIKITPHPQDYPLDFPRFFTVLKAGFAHPRKQLLNNLSTGLRISRQQVELWLARNDIKPTQRAETLSVQDWINLAHML